MRKNHATREQLTRAQRAHVVAFLREWLPDQAKQVYREMIRAHPHSWWDDPHFASGIIPEYALRGNGYDEKSLGIKSLERVWPDLLATAVQENVRRRRDA